MEFIFLNKNANKSGVTEVAYKACEEGAQQTAICELSVMDCYYPQLFYCDEESLWKEGGLEWILGYWRILL